VTDQVISHACVLRCEKSVRFTRLACSASTADAVDVVLNRVGHIVIHDAFHVFDVCGGGGRFRGQGGARHGV
jgi:hypothetical protein